MSPPDYPSAWLHPCSARFRFTRQVHCSCWPGVLDIGFARHSATSGSFGSRGANHIPQANFPLLQLQAARESIACCQGLLTSFALRTEIELQQEVVAPRIESRELRQVGPQASPLDA
jgi:hypothetical protein